MRQPAAVLSAAAAALLAAPAAAQPPPPNNTGLCYNTPIPWNPPNRTDPVWKPLFEQLDQWQFTDSFAVSVGVAAPGAERVNKELFVYERGNLTMHTRVGTLSTSKWPAAMMLAGAVNDGTIASLDDPVNKYVKWWTTDSADRRSRITMRHLLSFTSGFGTGEPGDDGVAAAPTRARAVRARDRRAFLRGRARRAAGFHPQAPIDETCIDNPTENFEKCTRAIYDIVGGPGGANLTGEPGTVYSYNSNHLQLAGQVVCAASGLSIKQVLRKYLWGAYNMTESTYYEDFIPNPQLAVGMEVTGHDYANFLAGVLGYRPLSKDIVRASEIDSTPFRANDSSFYGDYGFGHFLSCFDNPFGFTDKCLKAEVHADPGGWGYYPLIDRKLGYYLQLVTYEHTAITYPRSGIPEYFMQLIKPIVDDIIRGVSVQHTAGHSTPGYRALAMADVNYCAGCYLNPMSCYDGGNF